METPILGEDLIVYGYSFNRAMIFQSWKPDDRSHTAKNVYVASIEP